MNSKNLNKVQINITTYKGVINETMNEDKRIKEDETKRNGKKNNLNNNFVCSICLKSKSEDNTIENGNSQAKSCPVCQKSCDISKGKVLYKIDKAQRIKTNEHEAKNNTETKSVQTDLNKSLNLLNEVLTVFQNKKTERVKSKMAILKDASVSTTDVRCVNPKLSMSKIFQLSIDHDNANENGKFIVMSSKADAYKRSSVVLIKHKSSSIPQMKLEELKQSLKEKNKSKNVIEEVNRMYATVTRNKYSEDNDELNRPSVRSGPRILPVVKTIVDHSENHLKGTESRITLKNNSINNNQNHCKCCQTNNCLSSGDSITQCCHITKDNGRCDKCVYLLCCHYKNKRKTQAGVMICEGCRDVKDFSRKHYHERSFDEQN